MKPTKLLTAFLLAIGVSALALGAGSTVQRTTRLTVSEPTEVGTTLLQPGSYTLHVNDYQAEKVQVVITRDNDSKVVGTEVAFRARRNLTPHEASDNQVQFTYTTHNGHPAVSTWYYPGDDWGEQFAYGKDTMVASASTSDNVTETHTPAPTASTMAETAPAPAPPVETHAEATETHEMAPAPAPAPETHEMNEDRTERTLPKTASSTPLLALLGALSLAGAAAMRFGRKTA
jgi:LPXTG-motif cell wall-anchored protein